MKSRLTKALEGLNKRAKMLEVKEPGFKTDNRPEKYYNPLLTPPPRKPTTPEDFKNPQRLGHWYTFGFDWTSPTADKYFFHEYVGGCLIGSFFFIWLWMYGPDYKLRDWAKREAFLRTHKRELLGLPIIDRYVVDPERIVLPTEEELGDFDVHY